MFTRQRDDGRAAVVRHDNPGNSVAVGTALAVARCTSCGGTLIARSGFRIRDYRITPSGGCPSCGTSVPGRFDAHFDGQIASQPAVIRLRK
jgi:pyruvate formate lyase activating enzyme